MTLFSNYDRVNVATTTTKGKSLFAKIPIEKGEIIMILNGQIVRFATDYTIPIDHALWIEPRVPGTLAQFLCHSCEPNAGIKNRTLLVAMRDIDVGEEITTNYAFLGYEYGHERTVSGSESLQMDVTCLCGTARCAGVLQCYKNMPTAWREQYREFISDYLLDEARYPYVP